MEINIEQKYVAPKKHFDVYVVSTSWMHGDADGDGETDIVFPADKKDELPAFLTMLEKAVLAHPDGKGGYEGYDHVPGWGDYDVDYPSGGYDDCIPTLECYDVAFYDKAGERHDVSVVFTQEEKDAIATEMKAVNKAYDS